MYCKRLLFAKGKEIRSHLSILGVYFHSGGRAGVPWESEAPGETLFLREGVLKENQYFKKMFTSIFFSKRINIFQSLLCNIIKMDWLGPGEENFPSGASEPCCSTRQTDTYTCARAPHIHRHRDIHMHRHTPHTHTCTCIHQCNFKTPFFSFLDFSLMYRPCTWHQVT